MKIRAIMCSHIIVYAASRCAACILYAYTANIKGGQTVDLPVDLWHFV